MEKVLSKGQMFMIGAIFIIIGFVLLKGLLSMPHIAQEKSFQDASYLDRNLKNVRGEFEYICGIASMQHDVNRTAKEYLRNFSLYMRNEFDSEIFYVFVFSNGTNRNFSVTIGNFLQNNMSGTLNATYSDPTGVAFALNDTGDTTLEFNATSAWINATINYTMQNRNILEKFYFNASTKNYVIGFFDIALRDEGFFVRSKSTYNRTW